MDLTININSIDRTKYILWKSFTKRDNLNSKIDTCSFTTYRYGNYTWKPVVGDEIEVLDGSTKIFAGIILNIVERSDGIKRQTYDVDCKDWTHYLDRKIIAERFTNTTVGAVITSLISSYASSFTVANVNCDIPVSSIAFNSIPVSQAIQILAEQVNYSWYVDYDKDIHFFNKNIELSAFDITDTNGKYINETLIIEDDLSQLRNRVIIRGGEKEGSIRSETFLSDGEQTSFPLGYKYSSKPVVTVSGSEITVGLEFVNLDASYDAMWNFNEKYIRLTGSPYGSGTPITTTGTPLVPIMVQVEEQDSIDSYGVYEFKKIDKSIKTRDEAKQYAVAQLDAYKNSLKEGIFRTYESGLRSGQLINVQSDIRSIDEDFIIQSVELKMRSPVDGLYTITLATLRTVGIIDFLQKLLLNEGKNIDIGEDDVLEKFYTDHKLINITELVEQGTEVEDYASINITESIRKDPWTPAFCLAPYFPENDDDPRRPGRLGISFRVY